MCGIAGLIADAAEPSSAAGFDAALAHRGPDGQASVWFRRDCGVSPAAAGEILLYHRRLSILDPDPRSAQPMSTADGRHWVVFNGEIYNFRELRAELECDGPFRTTGDSEVLLRLLARDGVKCLPRLRGMFAFAWLDRTTRQMTLVRDQLGIKPLYLASSAGRFAFASEIAALRSLPWVGGTSDPEGIADFMNHGLTDHRSGTCLRDVRQLRGGELMQVSIDAPDKADPLRWWTPPPRERRPADLPAVASELRKALEISVARHLVSDRPVGITLSGGIDSSGILGLARYSVGRKSTIHAVGYCASSPGLSEERWMADAAAHSAATLEKVHIAPRQLAEDIDALIRCQGEPFGSTSIHAQFSVMRAASRLGFPVMLGGQGADELFAGYRMFQSAHAADLFASGRLVAAARCASAAQGLWRGMVGQLIGPLRMRSRSASPPRWIRPERMGPDTNPYCSPAHASRLVTRLAESLQSTSLPMLLRYEDRNAMHWGIENRVPFLDPDVVHLACSMPTDLLIDHVGMTKAVLRKALHGAVPGPILARRDKIGFATPESDQLLSLSSWVDETIRHSVNPPPFLDLDAFLVHWGDVKAGKRPYDGRIWRSICLLRWADLTGVSWN